MLLSDSGPLARTRSARDPSRGPQGARRPADGNPDRFGVIIISMIMINVRTLVEVGPRMVCDLRSGLPKL